MIEWAIALVVFILAFIGMALGVLRGGAQYSGELRRFEQYPRRRIGL